MGARVDVNSIDEHEEQERQDAEFARLTEHPVILGNADTNE